MAAKESEFDLEFAFMLQLQEAMAASVALQPFSSSSSFDPPLPPFAQPVEAGGVDDVSQILRLQTLELERFQQERRDSERCQAEMDRISEDLRRRAHDEKFAREILRIPDEEWDEYGDNFEKPIDQGFAEEEEPFKLYFKGLSESVPGSAGYLSAVGVAICDPQGKLVLKVQKPMPGPRCGREIMETKALIEGLNAVLSMGIKRVDIFFHHTTLYNHITRKWAVKQRKVAEIINHALSLQQKFDRHRMFLLPRCDMQFVFKLAKDAIDSQLRKTVESKGNTDLKETCNICLEDTDSYQMFEIDGCLHHFCFSCMKQHVEVKLSNGILPGCPHEGCKTRLNVESSKKFLTPKLIEIMAQRIMESSIPAAEKVYCPYPKCSALMSRSETIRPQQGSSSKQFAYDESGLRKCIKCNGLFCINCKVPWHVRMSCNEYKRFNPYPRADDVKLHSLANQNLWRQCVKCNHMIELASGCFHMTCRCGYEFCYTCGAEWKNKKATCSCLLWEEDYILDEDHDSEDFYDDDDDDDDYDDEYDSEDDYYA